MKIQMVDLKSQYLKIKSEIDEAIQKVISAAQFINGPAVKSFEHDLSSYLNCHHVVSCGNGTDALQIALMALDLKEGDEVIVPAFTYVATAEVIALLKLKPVMADVDPNTFNITVAEVNKKMTPKVLNDPSVMNFVYYLGKPAVIRDEEITIIKQFLDDDNLNTFVSIHQYQKGDHVDIVAGPFAQQKGLINEINKSEIILFVESLGMVIKVKTKLNYISK